MSGFGDTGQMVFVCDHVFSDDEPVGLVVHDDDGKWTFMCGSESDDGDDLHYVPLGRLLDRDGSLESISGLGEGMVASRGAIGVPWDQDSLWEE